MSLGQQLAPHLPFLRRYGRALTQGLTIRDVQDWPHVLQDVTALDVLSAARMVFDRKQSVTGWLMNEEVGQ